MDDVTTTQRIGVVDAHAPADPNAAKGEKEGLGNEGPPAVAAAVPPPVESDPAS